MKITFLGHAGFCVETNETLIIMDPWLSPHGAFDAAWFQYPKNHHLEAPLQSLLLTSTKNKYIYISHEHKDHFDIEFLQSLISRDFTLLLANFTYPVIKDTLSQLNYHCQQIQLLNDNEPFQFSDGVLVLFIIDTELNDDSAILVKSESHSFLNLNDCKIHDRLEDIVHTYGKIDLFTAQFSGASWYPTCYQLTDDEKQMECDHKIRDKFETLSLAIDQINPLLFLPSAGPPCFLDPLLLPLNFEKANAFPRPLQLKTYLNEHCRAVTMAATQWLDLDPGEGVDLSNLKKFNPSIPKVADEDFKSIVMAYAKEYTAFFHARDEENSRIDPADVFLRLKQELLKKIDPMHSVNHHVNTLLYWRLSENPEKMYCIDLAHKTIKVTSTIQDINHYFRITTPAWVMNKVLTGRLSWPDFALTFRLTLERVPAVYNTILHGFLILEAEKIHSFCEKMAIMYRRKERITIEHDGKHYSILKYCPHQGADLTHGHFEGCDFVCPRHQWRFDLNNQGKCQHHEATIEAIPLLQKDEPIIQKDT